MTTPLRALIGLGNPGIRYSNTRHNIGFMVLDRLAVLYGASWKQTPSYACTEIPSATGQILLVKPLTGMNNSGDIIPMLKKRGIGPAELLVVHDELELPFGKYAFKEAGSAKGHNGLRSIISACGDHFMRMRIGIGRPEQREEVPDYVLSPFVEGEERCAAVVELATHELVRKLGFQVQ